MAGVLKRYGINQIMTREHRNINLEYPVEFAFLNLRKFPVLMSHSNNQYWPSETFANPNQWQ